MQKIIIVTAFILIVSGGFLFYSFKNTRGPAGSNTNAQATVIDVATPTPASVANSETVTSAASAPSEPSPTPLPSPTLIPPGTQIYTMPDMTLPKVTVAINAKNYRFDMPVVNAKVKKLIHIDLTSTDADYGFAVKELNVNAVLAPKQKLSLELVADRAGTFNFVCTSNCNGTTELGTQLVIQ
jgi:heme/copper-type cytochrome/quinol oxidase subunit 2